MIHFFQGMIAVFSGCCGAKPMARGVYPIGFDPCVRGTIHTNLHYPFYQWLFLLYLIF